MNNRNRINRIVELGRMLRAVEGSVEYYGIACKNNPTLLKNPDIFRQRDIQKCKVELEDTFAVRIFAEFEITIRDFWEKVKGSRRLTPAKVLINRVASRRRIKPDNLQNVQRVREYRNNLLHGGTNPPTMTFDQIRSCLCKFIYYLPEAW